MYAPLGRTSSTAKSRTVVTTSLPPKVTEHPGQVGLPLLGEKSTPTVVLVKT